MGQTIEVRSTVLGDTALFDTDRSISGQDGQGFDSAGKAGADSTAAGRLAAQVFERDAGIDRVFVLSNQVTVRRDGGWNDEAVDGAAAAIRDSFVFYEENRGATAETAAG
jgi:hypothetical protein